MRQSIDGLIDNQVDMPGQQVLHRQAQPAIRHKLKACAGFRLEKDAGDMTRRSDAGMSHQGLVRVCRQPGDQFLQRFSRQSFLADDQHRLGRDQADRLEICPHVELERKDSAVQDMRDPSADVERVSIGCRAGEPGDADIASTATHVFNDDGLTERCPHTFGQDPRDRIQCAAGRERHDHCNGSRRIGLRHCRKHSTQAAAGRGYRRQEHPPGDHKGPINVRFDVNMRFRWCRRSTKSRAR